MIASPPQAPLRQGCAAKYLRSKVGNEGTTLVPGEVLRHRARMTTVGADGGAGQDTIGSTIRRTGRRGGEPPRGGSSQRRPVRRGRRRTHARPAGSNATVPSPSRSRYGDSDRSATSAGARSPRSSPLARASPASFLLCEPQRSRLYSRFLVFSRSRYVGGIVRSWTLATRGGAGLVAVRRHGGEAYAGWPGDFYTSPSSVKLLAPNASPARFRSIVAPLAARVREQENATGCTGR